MDPILPNDRPPPIAISSSGRSNPSGNQFNLRADVGDGARRNGNNGNYVNNSTSRPSPTDNLSSSNGRGGRENNGSGNGRDRESPPSNNNSNPGSLINTPNNSKQTRRQSSGPKNALSKKMKADRQRKKDLAKAKLTQLHGFRYTSGDKVDQLECVTNKPETANVSWTNYVKTSRYTWYDFLPRNIFEQFKNLDKIYFLMISILQLIPEVGGFFLRFCFCLKPTGVYSGI